MAFSFNFFFKIKFDHLIPGSGSPIVAFSCIFFLNKFDRPIPGLGSPIVVF